MHRVESLWRKSGPEFLVLYLKEAHRLLMAAIAGTPETRRDPSQPVLVSRDSRGVPRIIPAKLRRLIGINRSVMVLCLTVLTLYRVVFATPVLKTGTITAAFSGLSRTLPVPELSRVAKLFGWRPTWGPAAAFWSGSAGPNGSHATATLGLDAFAFFMHPTTWVAFIMLCVLTRNKLLLVAQVVTGILTGPAVIIAWLCGHFKARPLCLGRLSEKQEGAGKVRLFAITDGWTQALLKPLHAAIFKKLKTIPQDGTHDQQAPLTALRYWARFYPAFSFDLTAATDRIPVDLQVQVLTFFFGRWTAWAWKTLLVSRPWFHRGSFLRYSVGQPMGALSSWAMLALTHHFVVQLAAQRTGWVGWYPFYAVLGDDVVILGQGVADAYLAIMRSLGVDISMAKSLRSKSGWMEFAKRLVSPQAEVSPIGVGVLLGALRNAWYIPSLLGDFLSKGGCLFPEAVQKMLASMPADLRQGVGANRWRAILWSLLSPVGILALGASLSGAKALHNDFLLASDMIPGLRLASVLAAMRLAIREYQVAFEKRRQIAKLGLPHLMRSVRIFKGGPAFLQTLAWIANYEALALYWLTITSEPSRVEGNTFSLERLDFDAVRQAWTPFPDSDRIEVTQARALAVGAKRSARLARDSQIAWRNNSFYHPMPIRLSLVCLQDSPVDPIDSPKPAEVDLTGGHWALSGASLTTLEYL